VLYRIPLSAKQILNKTAIRILCPTILRTDMLSIWQKEKFYNRATTPKANIPIAAGLTATAAPGKATDDVGFGPVVPDARPDEAFVVVVRPADAAVVAVAGGLPAVEVTAGTFTAVEVVVATVSTGMVVASTGVLEVSATDVAGLPVSTAWRDEMRGATPSPVPIALSEKH